jgi:transcriptional regulator with XRE-family HTH domain
VSKLDSERSTFGENLRKARRDAGLTQSQLVTASGIPKPTLSRYENGHVMPSLATLARLAGALNLPEGTLLQGRDSPEEELFTALHDLGIEIDTAEDARRIAGLVAQVLHTRSEQVATLHGV